MTDTEVKDNTEVTGNTSGRSSVRNRNWMITSFDEKEFKFYENLTIEYEIYQIEVCPESGRRHKQGYVELKEAKPLTWMKNNISKTAHLEPRMGSQDEAINYCSKIDTRFQGPFERGVKKVQGKRNDLVEIQRKLKEKVSIKVIADEHFGTYIRYYRGVHTYQQLQSEHRTTKPQVFWRWGLTGTGKTRYCIEKHPLHYMKDGTKWWDGYDQQEAIIIDDFDGAWPFRDLLRLLDFNAYQGQTKGGYVKVNSPFIYITCEYAPEHYWNGNDLAQIMRRIDLVTEVTAPPFAPPPHP